MVDKINCETTPFDYPLWKGKPPIKPHYSQLITKDTNIMVGGEIVAAYRVLPHEIKNKLKACCIGAKTQKSARTSGVMQNSAVFGALPRVACREDYCRFSANTKTQPEIFFGLSSVARYLWGVYKKEFPIVAKNFEVESEKINKDFMKTGTPFSTVNVNKNIGIGYHKDAANFAKVYSNVLISKKNCIGGHFVIPEIGVAFEQGDGALLIVDGQKYPHAVSKITPTKKDWYRYSVVFYTLNNLKHCLGQKEEIQRSKKVTTERARKRAANLDPRVK